jgi:hypothetical protein
MPQMEPQDLRLGAAGSVRGLVGALFAGRLTAGIRY